METTERTNLKEALSRLTVDALKPLARLVTDSPPTRKENLVDLLVRTMHDEAAARERYDRLDTIGQSAIREAVYITNGRLDFAQIEAKYGETPRLFEEEENPGYRFYGSLRWGKPTLLRLFFPDGCTLPLDLQPLLARFVPKPAATQIDTIEELPKRVEQAWIPWDAKHVGEEPGLEVALRVRETEREGQRDLHAVLRLIEAGKLGVSGTTQRPGQAALRAVAALLDGGDLYTGGDEADGHDTVGLAIKAFAWPLIVQAAGFATLAGAKLQLTPAGRNALGQPAHQGLRTAWTHWLHAGLLDEFSRVNVIRGQGGQGRQYLTDPSGRRQVIARALADCPVGSWIAIDELFRFMRAGGFVFQVSREPWYLYIGEREYGSLEDSGRHGWAILQGRYIMAFLLEYAATMGMIDVAYTAPIGARDDCQELWGADDLGSLSRYDGLRYVRVNPLGAWCLDRAPRYEPAAPAHEPCLKVLPNRDVVVTGCPLAAGDVLFLERFAERASDLVWRLSEEKCLAAVEQGMTVGSLAEFLTARVDAPLPQTVSVFLNDIEDRATRLHDRGTARVIECRDAELALLLANDRRLRSLCQIAGQSYLVFRTTDEAAVRRALRELGYAIPPSRS